jgi:hypothetical protein
MEKNTHYIDFSNANTDKMSSASTLKGEAKQRAKNYMRLKDGYIEPKCTCKEHDSYCCQIHGSCPTCVKDKEPKQDSNFYKKLKFSFSEKLKQYFEETPREKILEDWAKSAEFDNVGPTVDDFLNNTNKQEQTFKQKLVIELNEYDYTGSSNDIYGMVVKVNGVEMPYHNLDVSTILEEVLEHLGYEVEIIETLDR